MWMLVPAVGCLGTARAQGRGVDLDLLGCQRAHHLVGNVPLGTSPPIIIGRAAPEPGNIEEWVDCFCVIADESAEALGKGDAWNSGGQLVGAERSLPKRTHRAMFGP
jgi:hypothetical protein